MNGPPLCDCHHEPMAKSGSGWKCRTKKLAGQRQWYAAHKEKVLEQHRKRYANPEWRELKLAQLRRRYQEDAAFRDEKLRKLREHYHKPDGGWLVKRRRDLARQRGQILTKLAQLQQEAEDSHA